MLHITPKTEDAAYTEIILDLAKNPLNKGEITDADITHSGVNPTCGDHVRMYAKLSREAGEAYVDEASFEGAGCAISIAAASLLTEEIKQMPISEILKLKKENIFEWLGTELGPSRVKCGTLCLETLQKGINLQTSATAVSHTAQADSNPDQYSA